MIEAEERRLIESVIELGDTVVREVMVPRTDMVTVTADFRVADAMEVAILNGYSRIPACGEGIDDVVGIVHAKDLMRAERDGHEDRPVSELARPAQLRARDQARRRAAAGDAAAAVPHGDRDRRVRRHGRAGHARGHHRGAPRRDRRRVRRRGRADRAAPRRRLPGERADGARRGERPPPRASSPKATGTPSAGCCSPSSATSPSEGESVEVDGWRLIAQRVVGRRIGRVRIHRLHAFDRVPAAASEG